MHVTPKEASKYYKLSPAELRKQAAEGKIAFTKTVGGHHRYYVPDEYHIRGSMSFMDRLKFIVCWCQ